LVSPFFVFGNWNSWNELNKRRKNNGKQRSSGKDGCGGWRSPERTDPKTINAASDPVKLVANWMKRWYAKAGYKRLSRILIELAD
jgi:hypothetical protein